MEIHNHEAQLLADRLNLTVPVRLMYRNRFGLRGLKDLGWADHAKGIIIMQDNGIVLIPADLVTRREVASSNRMLETWRELSEQGSLVHLDILAILSGL